MYKNIKKIPKSLRRKLIKVPRKGDYVKIIQHNNNSSPDGVAIVEIISNPDFHTHSLEPRYICKVLYRSEDYLDYYNKRRNPGIYKLNLSYGRYKGDWAMDIECIKLSKDEVLVELI